MTAVSPAADPATLLRETDVLRRRFCEAIDKRQPSPAERKWRLGLFERCLRIIDELEARIGSVAGKKVLDVGAAHGGDTVAFCARGANCVGTDKFDYDYARLKDGLGAGERLEFTLCDFAERWPFADRSFDVVLCMSVVEHVDDLDEFFGKLLRVLKPDGTAVVYTSPVLKMARRDPLFGLPLVALLPTPARRFVAERIFGRSYQFHLSRHTFYSAGKFKRFVAKRGFGVHPAKFADSPIMAKASRWPGARMWQFLVRHLAYDFILVRHRPDLASGPQPFAKGDRGRVRDACPC